MELKDHYEHGNLHYTPQNTRKGLDGFSVPYAGKT